MSRLTDDYPVEFYSTTVYESEADALEVYEKINVKFFFVFR